ncbi:Glycosyl transferase family 2 [Pseudoxanthomonas sp. GM95]|uniref:glycosyltransferase n=1 Tax=Pseudoxanthomonas sp. GM95 TaxID=1881043 RepID=UPI0008B05D6C|nr:glycosyltransferase [Pseudoxanthomonas sp. GM95]SEL17951.1 Glycosyl transferase family 2 [Pseudoxanthomonas sp. GM95]
MIAVLIPAHNEAALIGACLRSVRRAAEHPELQEEVRVVVAVDRCQDATAPIAHALGAHVIEVSAPGGVGLARAEASALAVSWGARWLSMTDADTTVPQDWLVEQLRHRADAFCGIVEVEDWEDYGDEVQSAFRMGQCALDGHMRVHGANMGVSADFYTRCGGFLPYLCSEDVALIDALVGINARIARMARPVVKTSARRMARATGGFSDFMKQVERMSLQPGVEPITSL